MSAITQSSMIIGAMVFSVFLSACQRESEGPTAAERALDELQQKYDELVEDKMEDPVQWAADDIENFGDWEYRVENLSFASAEDLAVRLNEFGNDKWEVIWLEKAPDGFLVILKRPAVSYLNKIPFSQLGKIIIGIPDGQE